MSIPLRTGMENLVSRHSSWLKGRNIALLSHAAAVNSDGIHSAELLNNAGAKLKALFGPEHGFASLAAPGKKVSSSRHKTLKVPIHSLYGPTRKPTAAMLKGLDTIVIDFQNIPARPYTYLATMLNVLESAEEFGLTVIVADRPVPLPNTVDGPSLEKDFKSFVAPTALPMAYGMTPGETARWIVRNHNLHLELKVAMMSGYHREEYPHSGWPVWVKPSPAITCWDSALCYLTTIASEAIPALNNFRNESLSFQAVSASWLSPEKVCSEIPHLRGAQLHPVHESRTILIELTSPAVYKPVKAAVALITAIQRVHGKACLWKCRDARPEFFDKLFGGKSTRLALQRSQTADQIAASWRAGIMRFQRQRREVLLYKRKPAA